MYRLVNSEALDPMEQRRGGTVHATIGKKSWLVIVVVIVVVVVVVAVAVAVIVVIVVN